MTDPLDILATPVEPVPPDPGFAQRLRTRLQRALAQPEGVSMTTTEPSLASAAIPYLAVEGARDAIDWYVEVLGARLNDEPIVMEDGRIGHSALEVSGGVFYLADAAPEIGVTAPRHGESPVSLMLRVEDADATLERVEGSGGRRDRDPYDGYGMRNAWIIDPFGHRWCLQSPL